LATDCVAFRIDLRPADGARGHREQVLIAGFRWLLINRENQIGGCMRNDLSYVPKFELGLVSDTPGVRETIPQEDICVALGRHLVGDWGEVMGAEADLNWEAISSRVGLIISQYRSTAGVRFGVITEPKTRNTFVILAHQGRNDERKRD